MYHPSISWFGLPGYLELLPKEENWNPRILIGGDDGVHSASATRPSAIWFSGALQLIIHYANQTGIMPITN